MDAKAGLADNIEYRFNSSKVESGSGRVMVVYQHELPVILAALRSTPTESHKAEYLDAVDGIETGDLFNLLLRRIDFDGMDPRTFSLAELQRAIKGAVWP